MLLLRGSISQFSVCVLEPVAHAQSRLPPPVCSRFPPQFFRNADRRRRLRKAADVSGAPSCLHHLNEFLRGRRSPRWAVDLSERKYISAVAETSPRVKASPGGPIHLEKRGRLEAARSVSRSGAVSRRPDPSRGVGPSRGVPIRLEKRGRLETAQDVYRRGRSITPNYD